MKSFRDYSDFFALSRPKEAQAELSVKNLSLRCGSGFALSNVDLSVKTGRIINIAHGQLMAMGAFIFLLLSSFSGATFIAIFLLTILISLVVVLVIEWLFIRTLSPIDMKRGIFMTIGIILMLKGLISPLSLAPAEDIAKRLGITSAHLTLLAIGIVSVLILLLFFRRSSLGLYIRAVSDNREAALSLGIPIERLFSFSWIIAGMAAVISGILLTIGLGLNPDNIGPMEARIFPAIVLGGLGSIRGAILGGILMGILETCAGGQFSCPQRDLLPYMILILILLVRPYGLFSDKVDLPEIKE